MIDGEGAHLGWRAGTAVSAPEVDMRRLLVTLTIIDVATHLGSSGTSHYLRVVDLLEKSSVQPIASQRRGDPANQEGATP